MRFSSRGSTGDYQSAIRLAYALYIVLNCAPESIALKDDTVILLYRTLAAYMGGYAAVHAKNGVMERIFYSELENIYIATRDAGVKARIRNHLADHNKHYNGHFHNLRESESKKKTEIYWLYNHYLDSTDGVLWMKAGSTALNRGADPDSPLRELNWKSPMQSLRDAVSLDRLGMDPEGTLFSALRLLKWCSKTGHNMEFERVHADVHRMMKVFATPLTNATLRSVEALHFANIWRKSRIQSDYDLATRTLGAATTEFDRLNIKDSECDALRAALQQ